MTATVAGHGALSSILAADCAMTFGQDSLRPGMMSSVGRFVCLLRATVIRPGWAASDGAGRRAWVLAH